MTGITRRDSSRYDVELGPASDRFPRNSEGSVVRLTDGRLLAAWTAFEGDTGDHATAHIRARMSSDDGDTWGEPFVLLENDAPMNTMSVSFLRETSGALLMAVLSKHSGSDCRLMVRTAIREPDVWSAPVRATHAPGYYVMNNDRLAEDYAGRIYAPVSWTPAEVWSTGEHFTVHVCFSDDCGWSWYRSRGEIDLPERGAMEPGIVETSPRRLLMILRSQLGEIYQTVSTNAGWDWSTPEPLGVASPESPATIGKLPNNRLALVYNPHFVEGTGHGGPRTPLRVAVSRDEGRTWTPVADLEDDPAKTYAYTSWYPDGERVFLTYYVRDEESGRISQKLTRLDMDWFD